MDDTSSSTTREYDRTADPKREGTFEQHQELLLAADRLRVIALAPLLSGPRLETLLRHELEQFRSDLRAHFAFEERGGYMVEIVAARPELASKVASLGAQHALMIFRLDRLVGLASIPDMSAVGEGLIALLELFDVHEQAERKLLLDSSCCDLGEAD